MDSRRRGFLAAVGSAATAVAGCTGRVGDLTGALDGGCEPLGEGSQSVNPDELDLPIPKSELLKAAPTDAIRAIDDPAFAPDWTDLDERLGEETGQELVPEDLVIGVTRGDRSRAYPLQVLYTHEVVNDDLGGPLVATYCPICGSSVTAERTVDGRTRTFGVSGYLWRADLVMYDRATESLWSQIAATAIRGPAVGTTLTLVPSTLTTWAAWRASHPETDVLLPPPLSGALGESVRKPYYLPYRREELFSDRGTDGLDRHTAVQGVLIGDEARAYPFPVVERERVVNDRVDGHPVLVAAVGGRLVAYDRCLDGSAPRFAPAGDGVARAGGSRFRLDTGLALDGPHAGTRLAELGGVPPMFWFAWQDFHPETTIYGYSRDATAGDTDAGVAAPE